MRAAAGCDADDVVTLGSVCARAGLGRSSAPHSPLFILPLEFGRSGLLFFANEENEKAGRAVFHGGVSLRRFSGIETFTGFGRARETGKSDEGGLASWCFCGGQTKSELYS